MHAAATHTYNGPTVKARVREELSEAGLVATPDQPIPRKPDFAGGPCFGIPASSVLFSILFGLFLSCCVS